MEEGQGDAAGDESSDSPVGSGRGTDAEACMAGAISVPRIGSPGSTELIYSDLIVYREEPRVIIDTSPAGIYSIQVASIRHA